MTTLPALNPLPPRRLLVVEDDPDIAALLHQHLAGLPAQALPQAGVAATT